MKLVEIQDVSKAFGNHLLFQQVNLTLHSGHIYGLVGPNGSGKSVFMKMLCGLSKPSSGKIIIDGKWLNHDIQYAPNTGVIIDKPAFFDEFSGYDNLMMLRNIQKKIDSATVVEYLQLFGLTKNHQPVRQYSLGMRQRLGLAQAFMESPQFVLLDEYSNGLDHTMTQKVKAYIKNYINDDCIIVLSSHYPNDLEDLVDQWMMIDDQRIVWK